jgi:hypothetical protein
MSSSGISPQLDSTLYCAYFGGPRDGLRSADLPRSLSAEKLTGTKVKLPLSQPSHFSIFAVYICRSESQIAGFWEFYFEGMEGPNGEAFVASDAGAGDSSCGHLSSVQAL